MMEKEREKVALSPRQWTALGISCLCGGALAFGWQGTPGAGFAAVLLCALGTGIWLSGKKRTRGGVFLAVCAALMAASYALFGNGWMKLMNLPVTLWLIAQSLFALSGHHEALSARGVRLGIARTLPSVFAYFCVPARAMGDLRGEKGRLRGLGLGVLITLPLLAVVTLLLGSADAVFGDMLRGVTAQLENVRPGAVFWKTVWALLLSLGLFSFLYALAQPPRAEKARAQRDVPALTCMMAVISLCAVEMLFVYVQVRYLFGGAQTAAMEGGYAQYARSGFFEMVAVAGVNLTVALTVLSVRGESKALRTCCALLGLCTGVILVSAAWRMRLYTLAYGMTLLRMLTLWAMAMIAACLALVWLKCARPDQRICAYLLAVVIAGWIALNYANVDACIARYNVRAYARGDLQQLDVEYLASLSPDALAYLPEADAEILRAQMVQRPATWFSWDASLLK